MNLDFNLKKLIFILKTANSMTIAANSNFDKFFLAIWAIWAIFLQSEL